MDSLEQSTKTTFTVVGVFAAYHTAIAVYWVYFGLTSERR